jgi:sugar/nucleoside kinase (ribokinase family)
MKVAIIGPICRDIVRIAGKEYEQPGGLTYYTGQALANLGIETVIFGTFGDDAKNLVEMFNNTEIVPIKAKGTIKFVNEYPDEHDYDNRIQHAEIHDNTVTPEHIKDLDLSGFDYIIFGPLLHGDTTLELIKELSRTTKAKLILSAQGMIRHLEDGKVIWKNPENALNAMKYTDYVFMDEEELKFIAQRNNIEEAANILRERGANHIVVTQGMHGSWIFPGEYRHIMHKIRPYEPKPLADPTGAGDSYLAGFIVAQDLPEIPDLAGSPARQGLFAAMTATMSIETKGPFNGTKNEVLDRLGWKY